MKAHDLTKAILADLPVRPVMEQIGPVILTHLKKAEDDVNGYSDFLKSKALIVANAGIPVELSAIHPTLFPFQRTLVQWALRKGRSAIFSDCGTGKTFMQLEWARLTGQRTLILAPLAVAQQTEREAKQIGLDVRYVRSQAQVQTQISVTNYEMLSHFDASQFGAVVLDESSILKSVDGKTRTALIETFQKTPYRLCCTATPAPNDIAEFANHSEFLGIASRVEMLSMFFVHDDDGWRMKGHAVEAFYRWMASWAMMLRTPSDLGFSDEGYVLPPLNVEHVTVDGDAQAVARAQGQLFSTGLNGITGRSAARKTTITQKVEAAAKIVNESSEQWIVWCGLNDEGREFNKACPDAVLVEGADPMDAKIKRIGGFLDGSTRVLTTKTSIAGFGLNLQNCHNMLFIGLNDSYESYYQAIRRSWRFGQESPVRVVVVISDVELPILENVQQKEAAAAETVAKMVERVSNYEREELGLVQVNKNGYHTDETVGEDFRLMLGDCAERMKELPDASVDLSVFSPPFLSLYVYSDSDRDMGNNRTPDDFFLQFAFMQQQLLRVLKPGRNVACHVSQVPAKLITDGFIGLKDFRGDVIASFLKAGFVYHGEVVIDKDPQAQAIRTHAKGLLFAQLKKDASWLRPGLADYILVFRKPGENSAAIHPDLTNDEWIEWARPIWYNIRESDTLNVAEGRSTQDERHIAPLQLGTIERCVRLWSNKGETVFSPFAGIGSEGYQAILSGRKFIGIELKQAYYDTARRNLQQAVNARTQKVMTLT